ncbi:hypothetical protein EsDP_00006884 [Epichloe bromicola]|uniref:Uncharacterized protein n=1 Tax=Epichloe bromicola TaxID=79588 RepID=A0ABQ0CYX5_9HYPO
MHSFKSFMTLGLACLAAWASPIAPDYDNRRSITDQSGAALIERAVPNTVVVKLWEGLGRGTTVEPTYTAKMSTGILGAPSRAEVEDYAKKAYENMMKQPEITRRESPTYLVAALYIPTTRSIYICSVPDKPAIRRIREKGATDAPAWWSQVQNRNPMAFHAEDGAAYLYESSLPKKLAAGDTYPAGSFIVAWGKFKDQNDANRARLCSGGGNSPLNPPCSVVFGNLNVGFPPQ